MNNKSIDTYATEDKELPSQRQMPRRGFFGYTARAAASLGAVVAGGCSVSLTNRMNDLSNTGSAWGLLQKADKLRDSNNLYSLEEAFGLYRRIPRVESSLESMKLVKDKVLEKNSRSGGTLAWLYEITLKDYGKKEKVSRAEVIINSRK